MPHPHAPPASGPPPVLPERYAGGLLLGQGGMGRVYRARDRVLEVDVAIKVIRPDLAAEPRIRERLGVEVRMAARIPHPHLVPLHDLGSLPDGTPFLAMALASGGSLGQFRGEWEELQGYMGEVLDALAALHARGVLHRDLKPENILLHDGHAWVSDLGLADVADTLAERSGDASGTPEYMAPEQRAGRVRELGPWTDLFAVGRVLDRLTKGMAVPTQLEDLLGGLLHPEPFARFELAADARHALAALGPAAAVRSPLSARSSGTAPTLYPSFVAAPARSTEPTVRSPVGSESAITELVPGPGLTSADPPPGRSPRPPPPPMPTTPRPEPGRGAHARASLALLALREVPLVARDGVRARVWQAAREVVDTRAPRVVLIVGEAGAGKTRLCNSVAYALEEGGWMETLRLVYRVPPTTEDGYGGVVRRLLRPLGESADSLEERLQRQFLSDFGAAAPSWAVRMRRWCGLLYPFEGPLDRTVGLSLLWERFRRRAWRGGTCLLLDDAHLADASEGLSIARNLIDQADNGAPLPVLVLASLRSDALAASPALARQVDGLVADGALRIDLARLDRAGTSALVDELLTLTPDVAELISARCEGNPLLARMLLCGWAEEGLLVEGGDLLFGLRPGLDVATALPDNSAGLFARRVATVVASAPDPEDARTALHALALANGALPESVHARIAGEARGVLARSGLFRREAGAYAWDHGLLHEAVRREAAQRSDVRELHRRIAEAWQAWGAEGGAHVDDQVGLHLVEAGEDRRALELLLPACKRAERSGRMAALLRLATAAQRAADSLGPTFWVVAREARYLRARALTVRGELDAAEKLVEEAGHPRRPDPAGDSLSGAVRTMPRSGEFDTFDEPLDVVPDADSREALAVEAYAAWVRGHLHRLRARLDDAAAAFADSRSRYLNLGDQDGVAKASLQLAGCYRHTHAFADAQAHYQEALDAWRSLNDPRGEAYALREMAVLAAWRGDLTAADEGLARARLLFRAAGEATGEGVAMMRQSQRAMAAGKSDLAGALLREAMHLFVANGALLEVQNCRNDLADVARAQGDLAAAAAGYRSALRWSEERGWREFVALGRVNLALVALQADDPLEAIAESDRIVDALQRSRNHWLRPFAEAIRATAHARMGHIDEAIRRLRSARKRGLGAQADRDLAWVLDQLAAHAAARDQGRLALDAASLAERVRPGASKTAG